MDPFIEGFAVCVLEDFLYSREINLKCIINSIHLVYSVAHECHNLDKFFDKKSKNCNCRS